MSVGKFSTENLTALYTEWKVQNFPSLANIDAFTSSPHFLFLGRKFVIKMLVNGGHEPRHIYLSLSRTFIYPDVGSICAQYRIGIKKHDGTEFKCWSEEYTFPCNGCSGGIYERVYISDIQKSNVVGPDGDFTIFCTLCAKKAGHSEVETQTELLEGAHKHVNEDLSHSEAEDNIDGEGEPQFSSRAGVKKLLENFKDLLLNEENYDVLMKVKEKEFKAHRTVLGARSRVFSSMFSHDTIEKNSGIIEISDCEPRVFQEFLLYLYTGKVKKIPEKDVLELYVIADKYDVQDLKDECVKFMGAHISLETICDILTLALRHNATELLQSGTNFFEKNVRRIIVSPQWISFLKENPVEANELHIKAFDYLYSKEK